MLTVGLPIDAWYAVAHARDVTGVLPVELHGRPVVLVRAQGEIRAWEDRCPHRHAPLSQGSVNGDCLRCPYHGWEFDNNGHCTNIPGLVGGAADHPSRRLTAVACQVQDGLVWVCVGLPPAQAPARLPQLGSGRVQRLEWSFSIRCDPVDAIENFLDPMHTHSVHPGLVRTEGQRTLVSVEVHGFDGGVEARYQEAKQSGAIARFFGADIAESFGRYRWPGVAQLEYRDGQGSPKLVITACFSPCDGRTRVRAVIEGIAPWWLPGWAAKALIAPLFRRTVAQDRRILESVASGSGPDPSAYAYSQADLLRPHIERLLAQPDRVSPGSPRTLTLKL